MREAAPHPPRGSERQREVKEVIIVPCSLLILSIKRKVDEGKNRSRKSPPNPAVSSPKREKWILKEREDPGRAQGKTRSQTMGMVANFVFVQTPGSWPAAACPCFCRTAPRFMRHARLRTVPPLLLPTLIATHAPELEFCIAHLHPFSHTCAVDTHANKVARTGVLQGEAASAKVRPARKACRSTAHAPCESEDALMRGE